MTDTPRTDAARAESHGPWGTIVYDKVCQIERDLNEQTRLNEELTLKNLKMTEALKLSIEMVGEEHQLFADLQGRVTEMKGQITLLKAMTDSMKNELAMLRNPQN